MRQMRQMVSSDGARKTNRQIFEAVVGPDGDRAAFSRVRQMLSRQRRRRRAGPSLPRSADGAAAALVKGTADMRRHHALTLRHGDEVRQGWGWGGCRGLVTGGWHGRGERG